MTGFPFAQVDVFATRPLSGNPLAVVSDADALTGEDMQRIANWTNLSETTFLLAPATPGADYRVRIFTPEKELPFAGHPTLGTCHTWLLAHPGHAGDTVVQECGAGLVTLRKSDGGRLAFAAPPLLRDEPADDAVQDELADVLGIDRADVLEARWVDNGPGWVAVRLASADAVLALTPRVSDYEIGVVGPYPPGSPHAVEVRAFFPTAGSLTEDPVTGSLNAGLAQWLLGTGFLAAPYVASQGTALGRAGEVHVTQEDGDIWVGGTSTTRVTGTLTL
ncbi:phenazine biosynthesis protein PhzF [Pseudonocardia sp. CNS-139]|nr:phenazine biosynthesis protein PhzF [Pseudonocardia sp. CNS-139]